MLSEAKFLKMSETGMIVLFTDFGFQDPYVGQLKSVLMQSVPQIPIVDLLHQVPSYNIQAASYLLSAYVEEFPLGTIFICVIDPGVGSTRRACVSKIDGRWFVGPDNGLLSVTQSRSVEVEWWKIPDPGYPVSASFHGRDIFAPFAAKLCRGDLSGLEKINAPLLDQTWPDDLAEVVYIDHYGNLISGYRYSQIPVENRVLFKGHVLPSARTFSDVDAGVAFFYENSNGLLEISVNQGSAKALFEAKPGDRLCFI